MRSSHGGCLVSLSHSLKMKKLDPEPLDASQSHQAQQMLSLDHHHHQPMMEISGIDLGRQQPLTIFYDGKICVSNVTDVQARTILCLARRDMEDKCARNPKGPEPPSWSSRQPYQACSPNSTLSMKKSLQRFLQKRKNRIHTTSPYNR